MKFLQTIFLLLCSLLVFSQNQVADGLELSFTKAKTKKEKALIQMELSDYWSYRDTVKAFNHLKIANQFVENDDFLQGVLLFYKGGVYYDHDIKKAQQLYMEAEEKLKKHSEPEFYEYRARLWHNYAALEHNQWNTEDFLNITLKKCIPFAEKSGKKTLLAGYYVDVGMIFNNYKEYPKAINYYNKAIDILKTAENKDEIASWAYLNLASTYEQTNQLELMKEALKNADVYLEKIPESQYNAVAFVQKTKYYNAIGNTKEALKTIEKGLVFTKSMNLDYDRISLKHEQYRTLRKNGNLQEAKSVLHDLSKEKIYMSSRKNQLIYLTEMASLEKELGNYEVALKFKEDFQVVNDSVQKENEKMQILKLESQYKTKEQQKSLEHLQSKNKQQGIIILISVLLLLVVISFFIYALKQRKKANEQELFAIQQHRKNEIDQALYEGEIQERERVAKDLHDGIGGRITGIKIHLENYAQQNKSDELQNLTKQLEICLSELRNTARNLTPETLKKFGLEDAIKDFCQNMSTSTTSISCYVKNLNQCSNRKKQIHIFHIVQETVNNAIKHSQASKILVQCTLENEVLLIDIEDNGKGFNPEKVVRNLGLNNIEKRVHALNGKINIQSSPENGTTVNIEARI